MKHLRRALSIFACVGIATSGGCAGHDKVVTSPSEVHAAKTQAPLELMIEASGTRGEVDLKLTLRATAAIPSALARFVLPSGVRLVSGKLEQELGALANGEERHVIVRVLVPATFAGTVAAGVDCRMTATVQLHKGVIVAVGEGTVAPADPGRVTPDGVRIQPARQK